jgi:hypothetical protein
MPLVAGNRLTSTNAVWLAVGALTTTAVVSVPVFLVGGLAVQVSDGLRL